MDKFVSKNPRDCKRCGKSYLPTSNRQEYCTDCQKELNNERCKERYKNTYVKKGYNQARENNNAWKGGVGSYRWFLEKKQCEWCSSKDNLLVHHKDHNRKNNDISNLTVVCKKCHQRHHVKRDPITGRFTAHL